MLAIVGTVPDPEFPLIHGKVTLKAGQIIIGGRCLAVHRGTPALIATVLRASQSIACPEIYAFLVGDIGKGEGSRRLYDYLAHHLCDHDFEVLTFHYLQPDVDWHNKVLFAIGDMERRPLLIADAGFMYAAKMSGQAAVYDFFTPDVGELAFLADEQAPHPFYTRGFILHDSNKTPDLIQRAHGHDNAANYLLVKGGTDYIAHQGRVIDTVDHPSHPAMEAMGGTGDSLTGLLTVLCGAGYSAVEAAGLAARANRWAGCLATPDPSTQVSALIDNIPAALSRLLDQTPQERSNERRERR